LSRFILKCLSKAKEERYRSAAQAGGELRSILASLREDKSEGAAPESGSGKEGLRFRIRKLAIPILLLSAAALALALTALL
jgi:hypothetical protein